MNNFEFAGKLHDLRAKARGHAHQAKLDKPQMRYGIRNWPVLLNPLKDEMQTPGVMLGGYNPKLNRWEAMYHFYDNHVVKLERVLEIGGKVPNQDNWEEIDLEGVLTLLVVITCPECGYSGLPQTFDSNPGGHCCPDCGYQGTNDDAGAAWEAQFPDDED